MALLNSLPKTQPVQSKVSSPLWMAWAMRLDRTACVFVFALSLMLNMIGIDWALPSDERSLFYPTDIAHYEAQKQDGRIYMISPYEPYHPDEGFLLDAMANINPSELDFNPNFFNYPSLAIYLTGGVLQIADMAGFVTIVNDKSFYIQNPTEMAKVYRIGRMLAAALSAVGVSMLYLTGRFMFQRRDAALLSAIVLATMPLWVRNSHFMLVNVPSASWMIACALFAVLAIHKQRTWPLLISALLAGLATSTKYTSGAVLLLPLFSLFYILRENRFARHTRKSYLLGNKYGQLWTVAVTGMFWLTGFLLGTPYVLFSPTEVAQDVLFEGGTKLGLPSLSTIVSHLIYSQGTVLVCITLVGIVILLKQWRTWQAQFICLFFVAGMAQRLISDSDFVRYIIPALPALALCAGVALSKFYDWVKEKSNRGSAIVLTCLLLLPAWGYSADILNIMNQQDIRTNVAEWIDRNVSTDQSIGVHRFLYYDMPPINVEAYDVQIFENLKPDAYPDVLIVSSVTRNFWDDSSVGNRTEIEFSQHPSSIWTWPVQTMPHDWAYTFIDLSVYYTP